MILLIIIDLFIIHEIISSIETLKRFNKSFSDFLHGRIEKIKDITHFPRDKIGQILKLINDNTKQAQTLISKEK